MGGALPLATAPLRPLLGLQLLQESEGPAHDTVVPVLFGTLSWARTDWPLSVRVRGSGIGLLFKTRGPRGRSLGAFPRPRSQPSPAPGTVLLLSSPGNELPVLVTALAQLICVQLAWPAGGVVAALPPRALLFAQPSPTLGAAHLACALVLDTTKK